MLHRNRITKRTTRKTILHCMVYLYNWVGVICDLRLSFHSPIHLFLDLSHKHIKIHLHSNSRRETLEMRPLHGALRLLQETSVGCPSQAYLVLLDNSILMICRRRIPGNTNTCAIVASNSQHSDRLWRGTWGYRGRNENKHKLSLGCIDAACRMWIWPRCMRFWFPVVLNVHVEFNNDSIYKISFQYNGWIWSKYNNCDNIYWIIN